MSASVLNLPVELMHEQAAACVRELVASVRQGGRATAEWALDAGALQRFDSCAIAVILAVRREVQAQGSAVRLVNAPARLQSLARLYGIDALVL
jgi:phospholipid transport system transporter-binding protein